MPNAVDPDTITRAEIEIGPKSVLVPGNFLGWHAMHEAHGKLQFSELFDYARGLAKCGFR